MIMCPTIPSHGPTQGERSKVFHSKVGRIIMRPFDAAAQSAPTLLLTYDYIIGQQQHPLFPCWRERFAQPPRLPRIRADAPVVSQDPGT